MDKAKILRWVSRKDLIPLIWKHSHIRLAQFIDGCKDRKVCGQSLSACEHVDIEGVTGYQAASYWELDRLFRKETFTANDHIIDVGCGKGRLLAYMLRRNFPGAISGVEISPHLAAIVRQWTQRVGNPKVHVIEGDALELNYNPYTLLYIFRPFTTAFFQAFIQRVEATVTHPIKFFYLSDQGDGEYLLDRSGWQMIRWGRQQKHYGLYLELWPQRYSVWSYMPIAEYSDMHD